MPTCLAIASGPDSCSPEDWRRRSVTLYEEVVRPVCEQLGLTFLRADRLTEAGLPGDQLLRMMTDADVVIADLRSPDAELLFGLGVRHGLSRCTVHVTESGGGPAGAPHLSFPAHADAAEARRALMSVLAESVREEAAPVLPCARAEPGQWIGNAETDEGSPGLFDLVVEAEAQMEALTGDMADVEAALMDLAAMMELLGEDMVRVSHSGGTTSAKLTVIHRLAKAMDGPADELQTAAERFAERMEAGTAALRAFLEWAGATPRVEWPEGSEELLKDFAEAPWDMQSAAVEYQQVLALIDMFAASSRQLRGPVRRVATSLRTIFRSVAVLEELQATAAQLQESSL
ncbi:hypothetical protein [Streptomyces sp. EN23]|uniref:hypothetical protein n=1 Tax=Streptomyces sp. EN23 TaxID=212774 RepID=UPI00085192D5|nr:hypothetical protein [Streptomyces sp. EN23]